MTQRLGNNAADEIVQAVELLAAGELVGMPTETVYGLAGDATNKQAVERIFCLKGRPASHPVIVHLADFHQVEQWAVADMQLIERLAELFWPGPLTLVLPRRDGVLDEVTGGQDSVAVRVPAHPLALRLLADFGRGVAAPSANQYGRISPTRADHVRREFGDQLKLVLDGGSCEVGLESTILSLVKDPEILRPGRVSAEELSEVMDRPVSLSNQLRQRAPGLVARHYAPLTPTELVASDELEERISELLPGARFGLITCDKSQLPQRPGMELIHLGSSPTLYARELYAAMRRLDRLGLERIVIEAPPAEPAWVSIRDRLRRASTAR